MDQNLDLWKGRWENGGHETRPGGRSCQRTKPVLRRTSTPEPGGPGPLTSSRRRGWVQMAVSGYVDTVAWVYKAVELWLNGRKRAGLGRLPDPGMIYVLGWWWVMGEFFPYKGEGVHSVRSCWSVASGRQGGQEFLI